MLKNTRNQLVLRVVDWPHQPQEHAPLREEDDGMSQVNDSSPAEDRPMAEAKKPYNKPDFRFERVFETTALACSTKNNAGNAGCAHPFKS